MIRPVRREDAATLAALEARAWRWAFVDIVAAEDMIEVADRERRWREKPLDGAFAWDQDGLVVGVVQVGPEPEQEGGGGRLRGLYVDPAAQGSGVGAALHDHGVAELRAAGHDAATLWVFTANGQAREFYGRRGWRPDGTTGEWRGVPELRMRLELATPAG